MKYTPPSVRETAFNCPHCGALARQYWYSGHADGMKKDRLPLVADAAKLEEFDLERIEDEEERENLRNWGKQMVTGRPFFESKENYREINVNNVWFSRCFNCDEIAIWICERMIYPQHGEAPPANPDLPPEIARDYHEASSILDLSPRGAAALIRLAIQSSANTSASPVTTSTTTSRHLSRAG